MSWMWRRPLLRNAGETTFRQAEGYTPEASLMKFSSDPISSVHRPLIYYAVVHFLFQKVLAPALLKYKYGMEAHTSGGLRYWYRPASDPSMKDKPPIVMIHGLGIGPLPYLGLLSRLSKDGHALIVPRLDPISQQMGPQDLHRHEFVEDMVALLKFHKHAQASFVGHSYGTIPVGWMAHDVPEVVAASVLLDPVILMLHIPKVMYSILYQPATTVVDQLTHFCIRSELYFNCFVRRNFFWYSNIAFLESFETSKTFILLSGQDKVVPVEEVHAYVKMYNLNESPAKHEEDTPHNHVVLLHKEDLMHGGFLLDDEVHDEVATAVLEMLD